MMTASQSHTHQLQRGAQARYSTKKRDLDTSMLQYSERMRVINTTRISLGGGLEPRPRKNVDYKDDAEATWTRHDVFMERRTLQKPDHYQPATRDQRQEDSLPLLGPAIIKSRRQRPLSFDEKELQQNLKVIKTRRRPLSFDERELQRNEAVNSQIRLKQYREAFTKPASPIVVPTSVADKDPRATQTTDGEVRISFVNASDLYDLVDAKRQNKRNENACSSAATAKLVNVSDAIHLVQDIGAKTTGDEEHRIFRALRKNSNPSDSSNSMQNNRHIKSNLHLNTDLPHRKDQNAAKKNKTKLNGVPPVVEGVSPLGVFLQQAVSDFARGNALTVRPKRAKRMSLRKPRLVDIPEDVDTALHAVQGDKLEPIRPQMPQPSEVSLQAIKELRDPRREDHDQLYLLGFDKGRLTQRPRKGEIVKPDVISSDDNLKSTSRKHKIRQSNKPMQSNLDLDKLLMTSIYPPVPWDVEGPQEQTPSRHFALPEKSSHKEKAQRKMKKLIFLRDRPEQHYRRDT